VSTQAALTGPQPSRPAVNFGQRPMPVFWEAARACLLACRHWMRRVTVEPKQPRAPVAVTAPPPGRGGLCGGTRSM